MTSTKQTFALLIFFLPLLFLACSSAKQDYDEVLKLQQATEQALQQTTITTSSSKVVMIW